MKNIIVIGSLTLSTLIYSCSTEQKKSVESDETEVNTMAAADVAPTDPLETSISPTNVEEQILFIREKYGIITNGMASGKLKLVEFKDEYGGGWSTYKRAMDGEKLRFISIEHCHDHGCGGSSYYFWDDQLIFKFDESSFWVGNEDKVSENRTYYWNEKEFRCLTKTTAGSKGYEAAKKSLASVKQDTLQCNSQFDRATIKEALDFTKEKQSENQASVESNVDHYICYKDDNKPDRIIWISFSEDSKAIQVKYKGSTKAIDLVFDKEEFYEGVATSTKHYNEMQDGKVIGVYKLTHAGNWDYVEYVRNNEGEVFKFTIDHEANPYGNTACF